jgi:alanyl-tRNA synthetase
MSRLRKGEPRQRAVRIGKLQTVMQVAAELGRVYRDMRHEKIDSAYGNRMASVLTAMRQCFEASEFERRIAEIEAAVLKASGRGAPESRDIMRVIDHSEPDEADPAPSSDRRH